MYLVLLIVVAGVTIVSNIFSASGNVLLAEVGSFTMQSVVDLIAMLFSAGLLYMGIKRAVGQKITWRLGFTAFSFTGKIIVASVLQFVMVMIGYLLLVITSYSIHYTKLYEKRGTKASAKSRETTI